LGPTSALAGAASGSVDADADALAGEVLAGVVATGGEAAGTTSGDVAAELCFGRFFPFFGGAACASALVVTSRIAASELAVPRDRDAFPIRNKITNFVGRNSTRTTAVAVSGCVTRVTSAPAALA